MSVCVLFHRTALLYSVVFSVCVCIIPQDGIAVFCRVADIVVLSFEELEGIIIYVCITIHIHV